MLSMNSWIPGAWLLATAARTSRESEATARSVAQSDSCPSQSTGQVESSPEPATLAAMRSSGRGGARPGSLGCGTHPRNVANGSG